MTAVHVWREEERRGQRPPALEPGDHRVSDLTGVVEIIDRLGARGRNRRTDPEDASRL